MKHTQRITRLLFLAFIFSGHPRPSPVCEGQRVPPEALSPEEREDERFLKPSPRQLACRKRSSTRSSTLA